jgi:hypothetical protein
MGERIRGKKIAELVVHLRSGNWDPRKQSEADEEHTQEESGQPETRVAADFPQLEFGFLKQCGTKSDQGEGEQNDEDPKQQLQSEQALAGVISDPLQAREQPKNFVISHLNLVRTRTLACC